MAPRMLVVLLLVFAVNYMDRQLLAMLIEPIKRDVGLRGTSCRESARSPPRRRWAKIELEKDDHDHLIAPEECVQVAMARQ